MCVCVLGVEGKRARGNEPSNFTSSGFETNRGCVKGKVANSVPTLRKRDT